MNSMAPAQGCRLRRERLVAGEFNGLKLRDDLCSPASNHVVEKLIPALAEMALSWDLLTLEMLICKCHS